MAGSINKVILLGRLGADPEIRVSQEGNKIARFSVATSESWKDKNTNEKKDFICIFIFPRFACGNGKYGNFITLLGYSNFGVST